MKHLKTFENFVYDDDIYQFHLNKYGKEFADLMLKSSQKGGKINKLNLKSSNDDIKEYVKKQGINIDTSNSTEDETIDRIIDTMEYIRNNDIFYRVVAVENKEDINVNNLGKHYTTSKDRIDSMFLDQIGIDDELPAYIITVRIDKNDIDIEGTIQKATEWTHEDEILLKDDSNVEVIDVELLH